VKAFLLLLSAALTVSCGRTAESPETAPAPSEVPVAAASPARPTLAGLPTGGPPRIGYVDHQVYVEPSGRRTPLPRRLGVSGIVPYAGGFLVADTLYFEGTVGLNVVREGRVLETHCSAGVPTRADGWVTWLVANCPESADFTTAAVHRARPDGSEETVREIPPLSAPDVAVNPETVPVTDLPRRWYVAASTREDRRHVLAVVNQGRWIAIVRIGPDGVRELATPVERFDPNVPAYALGPGR
jgi:hypothetical protein